MTIDQEMTLAADQLEALIDKQGLQTGLELISGVCFEKGAHVFHNWQDSALAKKWEAAGLRIEEVSQNPKIRSVS